MSKADTLKARLPRGFADRPAADLAATNRMLDAIRKTYELYGFEGLETPFVEYTEALGKFLPDQDRPNEGVFSFQDDDEAWLSLRYDLTAPLARYVAERLDQQSLTLPYRSYRAGWVFRNEKPGPGRFRQFMQFDADTVGSNSPAADAEICMMMADTLEAVGIPRGQYVVKVNNRKILDGVMEAIGLGGDEHAGRRLTVLRALDKYDRLGADGVRLLLGAGRKDESGDVTKGAGLDAQQSAPLIRLLEFAAIYNSIQHGGYDEVDTQFPNPFFHPPSTWVEKGVGGGSERVHQKAKDLEKINPEQKIYDWSFGLDVLGEVALLFEMNDTLASGIRELASLEEILQQSRFIVSIGRDEAKQNVGEDNATRIIIDPSVVRGLEYYTGPVFEAELTTPIADEKGQTVRFGSVGGGGRYDGLVGRFRTEAVPATGFSMGVSRLMAALQHVKSPLVTGEGARGPVVVLVMDRERIGDYQRMAAKLRAAGIAAEMYLGAAGMKAQMKYADRRRAPCVIIQGSQEKERGEVQIKDLALGAERANAAKDASHDQYKAARLAQVSVPEDELVDAVNKMLAGSRR